MQTELKPKVDMPGTRGTVCDYEFENRTHRQEVFQLQLGQVEDELLDAPCLRSRTKDDAAGICQCTVREALEAFGFKHVKPILAVEMPEPIAMLAARCIWKKIVLASAGERAKNRVRDGKGDASRNILNAEHAGQNALGV